MLEGKDVVEKCLEGSIVRLSKNGAEMTLANSIRAMTNLKMNLFNVDEKLKAKDFYGKVIKQSGEKKRAYIVHFTSIPPEVDAYFQAIRLMTV